jgi:hypothetical protein
MSLTFTGLIYLIIVIIIAVLITQLVWNMVMPDVFGTREINFWQTFGLLILSAIFFGGNCNATNISYVYSS